MIFRLLDNFQQHCEPKGEVDAMRRFVVSSLPPTSEKDIFLKWLFKTHFDSEQPISLKGFFNAEEGEVEGPSLEEVEYMASLRRQVEVASKSQAELSRLSFVKIVQREKILTFLKGLSPESESRQLLKHFLQCYACDRDRVFFALELAMDELLEAKPDSLVDLIVEDYRVKAQDELLKRYLKTGKRIAAAALEAVERLRARKTLPIHICRLIHINNRFPQCAVQDFLLEQVGHQQLPARIYITQSYLLNQLSEDVDQLPDKTLSAILLEPQTEDSFAELEAQIQLVFYRMILLPIDKYSLTPELEWIAEVEEGEDSSPLKRQKGAKQARLRHRKKKAEKVEKVEAVETGEKAEKVEKVETWTESSSLAETSSPGLPKGEADEQEAGEAPAESEDSDEEFENSDSGDEEIEEEGSARSSRGRSSRQSNNSGSSDCDSDSSEYLHPFTEGGEMLEKYAEFCELREILDVAVQGDYHELWERRQDLLELFQKIKAKLDEQQGSLKNKILLKMPEALVEVMRKLGLAWEPTEEQKRRLRKMRKPASYSPEFDGENWFQEEEQSNSDGADEDEGDHSDEDEEEEASDGSSSGSAEGSSGSESAGRESADSSQSASSDEDEEELKVPMGLRPSYSTVFEEAKAEDFRGGRLEKLLEIALYQLFLLTPNAIESPQVVGFYSELLQSSMGEMFLGSAMSLLTLNEGTLREAIRGFKQTHPDCLLGLEGISLGQAGKNFLFLLQRLREKSVDIFSKKFYGEHQKILPGLKPVYERFGLGWQKNIIHLLCVFVSKRKEGLRKEIRKIEFPKQVKLTSKEVNLVIAKICEEGSDFEVWNEAVEVLKIETEPINNLLILLTQRGRSLFDRLSSTGAKISDLMAGRGTTEFKFTAIRHLLGAQAKPILQFQEFVRKILDQIFKGRDKGVPPALRKHRKELLCSAELIGLVTLGFHFLRELRKHFPEQAHLPDFKASAKILRDVILVGWMFVRIFAREKPYQWKSAKEMAPIAAQYPSEQPFRSLFLACNWVFEFLDMEIFCTRNFRELLMPYAVEHPHFGRALPLIFKTSSFDRDISRQHITVTRKCSFDMSFFKVARCGINIKFHNEEGSDYGGLIREFMLGWKGRGFGEEDEFFGKILGTCFWMRVPYGGFIDFAYLVAITQFEPTLDDFEAIDPEVHRNLQFVAENDPEPLSLTMTVTRLIDGVQREFELFPGGSQVLVTQANKADYLARFLKGFFWAGREQQLKAVQTGFYSNVNPKHVLYFTPEELLRQLRGEEILDSRAWDAGKQLRLKTKYDSGYDAGHAVIRWFWEIVDEFDRDQINKLIQFITGSPKIMVYNRNFEISIDKVDDTDKLPVAHTWYGPPCSFNTLDLPDYASKELLRTRLLLAIMEGNTGFGIL